MVNRAAKFEYGERVAGSFFAIFTWMALVCSLALSLRLGTVFAEVGVYLR